MAVSARLLGAVRLAAATVLLGACAHSGPAHDSTAAPQASLSPSASTGAVTSPSAVPTPAGSDVPDAHRKHRPYSDVNPRPRGGGDFVITKLTETRDLRDADGHALHPAQPGLGYWAVEVRTCVKRSSHVSSTVGWGDWRAEGTDGRIYPADPDGVHPLPTPTYPFRKVLAPGQCVTGWWFSAVPKLPGGAAAFQFAPGGGPTLIEWLTLM
jgi:hypothetical protein